MASRTYRQFQYSLEDYPVTLYGKFIIDDSGLPLPLEKADNKGIYSVEYDSDTNGFMITFGVSSQKQIDKYHKLLDFSYVTTLDATPNFTSVAITTNDVTNGRLGIIFYNINEAPIIASGTVIFFKVVLSNSTL